MRSNRIETRDLSPSYSSDGDRTGATDNISGSSTTFGYNQAKQLISYAKGSTTASYSYDGDGLRASKTVNDSSEGYVWDLAEGMPTIIEDGGTRYITGPSGLPIEQVDGSGATSYYLQDQLGSTRGLTDSTGQVVGRATYDAYGNVKGQSGSVSTPFGYAGQYTDSEFGLQYLRARYYDPSTEQFLTVDPLAATTQQPYSYAGSNPANWTDRSGMCGSIPLLPCPSDILGGVGRAIGQVGNTLHGRAPVAAGPPGSSAPTLSPGRPTATPVVFGTVPACPTPVLAPTVVPPPTPLRYPVEGPPDGPTPTPTPTPTPHPEVGPLPTVSPCMARANLGNIEEAPPPPDAKPGEPNLAEGLGGLPGLLDGVLRFGCERP
jgi:RHS repeat-associated protein